jgi:hypothetical protein
VTFKKLPPLPGRGNPCLNCPPIPAVLDMRRRIAVGFGFAALTCDGKAVWVEQGHDYQKCLSVRQAENKARKAPRHDWRIILDGPLHGETYQRQERNCWVLVEKNEGFA